MLKQEIETRTALPTIYQRLLARGTKLEVEDATLAEAGLQDRTRIMLLHNALYSKEKDGFESLSLLAKQIDELAAKKKTTPANVRSELITRICCRLDDIDTMGSENLRTLRKELIQKAENMDSSSSSHAIDEISRKGV
jgi:hypothetical protein